MPRTRYLPCEARGLLARHRRVFVGIQDRDGALVLVDRIAARLPFVERVFAGAGYQGPCAAAVGLQAIKIVTRIDRRIVVRAKRGLVELTMG